MGDDSRTNPTEMPSKDGKTELTEEELSKVTGGDGSVKLYQNCASGKHIATGKIVV